MRKMATTSAVIMAMLGVASIAPAKAQTVWYEAPGEAIVAGEAMVTAPTVRPYGRRYISTYEPTYAYAPPPVAVQCGWGIGCRYYPENYPYWDRW